MHTIVYGGTSTGETYIVRKYLKLYQQSCFADQDQDGEAWSETHQDQKQDNKNMVERDRRSIIIVCKDERDWINPETGAGEPYSDFNLCDKNMITSKNMHMF